MEGSVLLATPSFSQFSHPGRPLSSSYVLQMIAGYWPYTDPRLEIRVSSHQWQPAHRPGNLNGRPKPLDLHPSHTSPQCDLLFVQCQHDLPLQAIVEIDFWWEPYLSRPYHLLFVCVFMPQTMVGASRPPGYALGQSPISSKSSAPD